MRLLTPFFFFACTSDKGISTYNATPTASITSHADGSSFMVGTSVTFTGNVSDSNHDSSLLEVTWYAKERVICDPQTPENSGATTCTATITSSDDTIRLVVIDPEGAAGTAIININILESTPPAVTLLSPLETLPYYEGQIISFSALLSDAEDPPNMLLAEWTSSMDGLLTVHTTPDSNGFIEGFATLSQGTHIITLQVTDSTDLFTITNEIIEVGNPNTEPTCAMLTPENNSAMLSSQSVDFSGSVADVETTTTALSVSWYSNLDGLLGSSVPSSLGDVYYSHPSLSVGTHVLSMLVQDGSGGSCSDMATVVVSSAPSVQITDPASGSIYPEGSNISFLGIVQDEVDMATALNIEWNSDIDGLLSTQNADSFGITSFSSSGLSFGSHTIQLSAENSAQIVSTASVQITVNGIPSAPSVVISPTTATTIDDLTATASGSIDPEGGSITYSYEWFQNGSPTTQTSTQVIASITQKNDTWTVRATPSDGLSQGAWAEASITISNSLPTPPVISISPSSATEGVEDIICSIDTLSTDADGDSLNYTFEWYDPSGNLLYSTPNTTATSDTLSASNTTSGTWECVVYANDGQADGADGLATIDIATSFSGCQGGSSLVSMAPMGNMVLCDHPQNSVCEQDFETLCPTGWHLCTHKEFNNRNDGWTQFVSAPARALGVRYCRSSGAGHFTVPDSSSGNSYTLGNDEVHNCYFGTSRPECTSGYGCNETEAQALCCSPNPLCGNGVVDSIEENCDDGNSSDADSCLNVCDHRRPSGSGTNCN